MSSATYDWTQFTARIYIEATVERVFAAWTDSGQLSKWFAEISEIEPRKNGRLYFEWLGGDVLDTKILEFRKNRVIRFEFHSDGFQVKVGFRKKGRGAICEMHQFGMKNTPKARREIFVEYMSGWAFYLTNLKAYIEHGIDLRSHDRALSCHQGYVNC